MLIQKGTLVKGDAFVTGIHYGRVRDLFNDRGQWWSARRVLRSRCSCSDCPGRRRPAIRLGSWQTKKRRAKSARAGGLRRRSARSGVSAGVSLDHLYEQIQAGSVKTLNLIIKAMSTDRWKRSLHRLKNFPPTKSRSASFTRAWARSRKSDINLAVASTAIIIGFHLSPNSKIRELAKKEGVDIRTYRIIYEAIEAMKKAMEGMLEPEIKENVMPRSKYARYSRCRKSGPSPAASLCRGP